MKLTKNSFSYEDLIECAHGKLFGPGNAQLPLPPMLMLDRVTSITENGGEHGKGQVVAELDIKPDMWFFPCHFENDPVMPGCLGLDAMWQLVGFFLGWLGGIGRGLTSFCFGLRGYSPLRPEITNFVTAIRGDVPSWRSFVP